MKPLLFMAGMLMLWGCTKKEDENPAKYAGTYSGNVEVYLNGTLTNTILNHSLIIHPATVGDYAISNNLITRSTAPIINNTLSFARARVGTGQIDIYEYGTGQFSGNTLTLELYQDEEDPASHTVIRSHKYTGVLTKQ